MMRQLQIYLLGVYEIRGKNGLHTKKKEILCQTSSFGLDTDF